MPSDHFIQDPQPLFDAIGRALPIADEGKLITFGIAPKRPETGYGYITGGQPITPGVLHASGFVEKPAKAAAEELIGSGKAYWNSGMFLFRASAFLSELQRYASEIHDACQQAMGQSERDGLEIRPDPDALAASPSTSIDYAVMEHSGRIAVAPVELDWSDVGSWASIYELADKDPDENVVDGSSVLLDSKGCLVRSNGPKVTGIGIEDLVIIATADHVLVVPRSEAQRVREAAELAKH